MSFMHLCKGIEIVLEYFLFLNSNSLQCFIKEFIK